MAFPLGGNPYELSPTRVDTARCVDPRQESLSRRPVSPRRCAARPSRRACCSRSSRPPPPATRPPTTARPAPPPSRSSTEAIAQANELADAQIEDTARLAADRNDDQRQQSPRSQEKDRVAAVAAAKAAAKARREAAEKVAREKARKALEAKKQAILANAQEDPRAAAQALLPEFGFERGPVGLPRPALDGRERLALHRRELLVRRLRHPAVAAGLQDGHRRPPTSAPTR